MNLETGIKGRNPPWSRDELILAMNLYLAEGLLDDRDPLVTELSARLQELGIHTQLPDPTRFRNPNGVALKLANFASLDPAHEGVGMRSIGRGDREVWDEFLGRPDDLAQSARAILADEGPILPDDPTTTGRVMRRIPVEANVATSYFQEGEGGRIQAERRESRLVEEYRRFLTSRGREITSHVYALGESDNLRCDMFDESEVVLYEAKGVSSRHNVRLAIGQLFDYARYEETSPRLAILLPAKPVGDLMTLCRDLEIGVVWQVAEGFEADGVQL